MSKKVKLEHYVPRCYLKNFSIMGKEDFLFCFDKLKSITFMVNSRNLASESAFYDTYEDGDQRVEKTLSYLESSFNTACRKLLATEDLSGLTGYDLMYLARFIATQELRTKEHRTRMKSSLERVLENSRKMKQSAKVQKEILSLTHQLNSEERIKSLHVSMLQDIRALTDTFCMMAWALLINCTSLPFWCSDHPVNHYYHMDMSPFGNLGLKCGTTRAYLPLSPKICLCFREPTVHSTLRSKHEVRDIRQIVFQNYLQVYSSSRYVFSNGDDFSIAEQIVAYRDKSLLRKPW